MMARAIQLAWRGRFSTHPNPRVGCVICQGDAVVGEGWHERAGEPHAEVHALRAAGERARGATAYVTLEPCSHYGRTPPCADALVSAGVSRVVVAMIDPNPSVAGAGLHRLREAGIEVVEGVLAAEAEILNPGYLYRMRRGRPFFRVKVAASLDGRTAMASGESQWITGPAARRDVQRLRAMSDAILTGVGTILADDPSLTVRPDEMGDLHDAVPPGPQPQRIILDTQLRTPPTARVLGNGPVVIFCGETMASSDAAHELTARGARIQPLPLMAGRLALPAVARAIAEAGINEVLVEAGPTLAGAAVSANLVDEFWLYQAPVFLGSDGRPTVTLPLSRMAERKFWKVRERRQFGDDLRLILTPDAADA
ncbi:bifunctional diaminohydroxyphosphoribosylaminopyrimidine deaminase/5-amino-6-(5-phosphoribosylamino)uracil reductase RibD [Marinobacter halodurans]|uniref:Riboflavin biosynthesis protein RibD n=1 Tax=Marinobacter halodurans TaxID=2528979 RepID=A0ABY1ZGG9_9GAMM|nr:bifunctional diaminohydroxyphosphoribosylaminopyrimidine deaminase/5-amino-6-(5-phosphoribosylamino)uracil reductase RibD [Marinobacter halodurans]TBW51030.1 bifunctional diaminohydroxyphosphoribosylaminopyrimidine deaminase/5-amino-6-(5-phosphoribosylamino)uracil reductase RibD [Marinobacter halodurans]